MTTRNREGSTKGLYVAAKGGHNAESHNHNDVGNFIIYIDGKPVIIDIGVETYSRKTFSSQRYEIWTMQSAYHSLPTIDGVMQAPGGQFAARDVRYKSDDRMAQLTLDIAGAYPEQARLKSWVRAITLNRGRDVTVVEDYTLTEAAGQITLSLMTPCSAVVGEAGQILLSASDRDDALARVIYDASKLTATIEVIDVEDGRLRSVWPEKTTRILLTAKKPALKDTWTLKVEPTKP